MAGSDVRPVDAVCGELSEVVELVACSGALEFGHFSILAERDNDANSWFGGRNAAVPRGGFVRLPGVSSLRSSTPG